MPNTERGPETSSATPPTGDLNEAILIEGRRLLERACTGDKRECGQAAVMTDELLDRTRRLLRDGTITPHSAARVMRGCALIRNKALLPALPPDPLVYELIAHTVRHGLAAHNAAAQALRGILAVSRGSIDDALDAAVEAMITIELVPEHSVERALAMNDTGTLLGQLALTDVAIDMFGAAAAEFAAIDMFRYHIMTSGEQVRSGLLHGLWLERLGRREAAEEHFANAGRLAAAALQRWEQAGPEPMLDEEFRGDFVAALSFADPDGDYEDPLRKAASGIALHGQIMAAIALARMLARRGRPDEAGVMLAELRQECRQLPLPMPLMLALAKGMLGPLSQEQAASDPTAHYLTVMERLAWVARDGRRRALHSRLEHERLRRVEGTVLMMNTTDPVTRLPGVGALDEMLEQFEAATAGGSPACLAMVDVDNLTDINQRNSFVEGDAVLRAVAVTLRAALSREDSVLRYSADDFVVLMPGRTIEDAAEVMTCVVTEVTKLPRDRGCGATVSIGLVTVRPGEGGESALFRADDATTEAKARGGNQVTVPPATAPR